jgi:hypothetical protein
MLWARMLAYISGTVDQELLLRNEYLAAENRILRAQVQGRLLLSDAEKATLAEIAYRLGRKASFFWDDFSMCDQANESRQRFFFGLIADYVLCQTVTE